MRSFPKDLVLDAMGMPGVFVEYDDEGLRGFIDHAVFDHSEYFSLLRQIQACISTLCSRVFCALFLACQSNVVSWTGHVR